MLPIGSLVPMHDITIDIVTITAVIAMCWTLYFFQLSYLDHQQNCQNKTKHPSYRIFCRCNIFEIVAIVNLRHRMIICQKIRLSQPIEMCTQFMRTQMLHIFPRNEHRKIFSTIQRQFLNTTEIYSGGSKAVWSFSENSSKFGNSIVPYLGRQI